MITLKPFYINGQKTHEQNQDKLTIYFEDGKVKAEGNYINDMMEGKWLFYKKAGHLWQIGHFVHDQKQGEWIVYDEEGKVISRKVF